MRRSQGADESRPRSLVPLFLGSGTAAVVVAVVNVVAHAAKTGVGLIGELDVFYFVLGEPGVPRFGFAERLLGWGLPAAVNRQFDLRTPGSFVMFLALSIALTLVVFWALAVLLAPLVALLNRGSPNGRVAGWFWDRAYPLGVLVGFTLPGILSLVHCFHAGTGRLATLVIGVGLWWALLWLLHQPNRTQRFVRIASITSLAVASVSWIGAALAITMAPTQPASARGRPNILLVSIDSLRSDHVHSYGYTRDTSPTLDQLAQQGVRFRTVVSPTSWTLPAHLTLLTSLPPEEHGVVRDGMQVREDGLFLAEVLWAAGYTTAGFVSAPYLDALYGFSQGFDHYDDYTIAKKSFASSEQGITSPALLQIVSRWLDRWDAGGRQRPFFVFMHMWDVHYDYHPPPPYDSMFDPGYTGTVTADHYDTNHAIHAGMPARDLEHVIALYDGEIRFTDLHLGRVLDRLRALGVLDDTIVVIAADHGDEFFEHGHKGHKKTLYDESVLVPLIMRFPKKIPAGSVVDSQVRLMDIAPTILSLAGVTRPADFGSQVAKGLDAPQDLTPWFSSDPPATPSLIAHCHLVGEAPVPIAATRTPAFKFIKELQGPGSEELYDLKADPHEQVDLARRDPADAAPFRQGLVAWCQAFEKARIHSQSVALSEEHKERLRALGYLK